MKLALFEPGTHDWEFSQTIIEPAKPLKSARFHAFIREQTGTVWFDDLFFGEPGGDNLLRDPGFEGADQEDTSARDAVFDTFADLNANALHIYLSRRTVEPDPNRPEHRPLDRFLEAAHARGLGVWVTMGWSPPRIENAEDEDFPEYYCVNGRFGREWPDLVATAAQHAFDAVGFVPDEYNWTTGRPKQWYGKHADETVRRFYAELPSYCNCPDCRTKYREMFGRDFPALQGEARPASSDPAWLDFAQFRYASTTDWVRRTAQAARAVRPDVRLDSMICVTPICSDNWLGPGVAWDEIGYHTDVDFLQTDPYLLLHNYLGDSTHWYITETAAHLTGASRKRQSGVTLEASRLRPSTEDRPYRNHDPVEVYGCAYSALFQGAREFFWWHYTHITGQSGALEDHQPTYEIVRDCYSVLERADAWFAEPLRPPRLAVLHSRVSEDMYRRYVEAHDTRVLTHATEDVRYGHLAQKELLYLLFRRAVPFDLFYLEQVSAEELAPYDVLVLPFPFALSDDRAALLTRLANSGKRLLILSEFGRCDERGRPRTRGALLDLIGLEADPSGSRTSRIPQGDDAGDVTVYASVAPSSAHVAVRGEDDAPVVLTRQAGRGTVIFGAGPLGLDVVANRENEERTVARRVDPSPLSPAHAALLLRLLTDLLGRPASLIANGPIAQDVEVNARQRADDSWLILLTNWSSEPVELLLRLPGQGSGRVVEGFAQMPGGAEALAPEDVADLAGWSVALRSQESRLVQVAPSARP
jgi:hypothetical protein